MGDVDGVLHSCTCGVLTFSLSLYLTRYYWLSVLCFYAFVPELPLNTPRNVPGNPIDELRYDYDFAFFAFCFACFCKVYLGYARLHRKLGNIFQGWKLNITLYRHCL